MTFVLKLQAPFERLRLANSSPEIALRRAVILQAIIDASSSSTSNKQSIRAAIEAKEWLFGDSESFRDVCHKAGFAPNFVVKIAKEMIRQHIEELKIQRKVYKRSIKKKTLDQKSLCSKNKISKF